MLLGSGIPSQGVASGLFNVRDTSWGARGDGTTDDTAAIQAAITAAQAVNGTVYLPRGTYKLTAALTVTNSCKILGEGCRPIYGSISTDFNTINLPVTVPYMYGTVLLQTAAATDVLQIGGAGLSVDLAHFGIRFADAIKFQNTGHAVNALPALVAGQTYYDNGVSSSLWDDLTVFGHDGNHYAFRVVNGIYNTMRHLRSFGGGGLWLDNNGTSGAHYGNLQCDHFYAQVFCAGSGHGINLTCTTQFLNLLQFNRPQITVNNMSGTFPAATAPSNGTSQRMFRADSTVYYVNISAPDFETGINADVTFPTANYWIEPGGLINSFSANKQMYGNGTTRVVNQNWEAQDNLGASAMILHRTANSGSVVGDLTMASDSTQTLTVPGPVKVKTYATGSRPTAATAGAGANIFDSTLNKPVWSDGTNWRDAAGTVV